METADLKDKIKGVYYGWFFGPGAILRKTLSENYWAIQKNPKYQKVNTFKDIPSDYKMYDQLTQSLIVHSLLIEEGEVSPESLAKKLLELNEKHDILNNEQYGPSTRRTVEVLLQGSNPRESGKTGVTTGNTMRSMPIGVYFYNNQEKIINETYQSSIISHNTDIAIESAIAVNIMIANLLKGYNRNKALSGTLELLQKIHGKYGEPTAFACVYERIQYAVNLVENKSFEEATELIASKIGFSWFSIEAIPAGFGIYFATKNAEEAELMAFKLGYNHTAPQIACAFHGAEKGTNIFPTEILEKIERVNHIDLDRMTNEMLRKMDIK